MPTTSVDPRTSAMSGLPECVARELETGPNGTIVWSGPVARADVNAVRTFEVSSKAYGKKGYSASETSQYAIISPITEGTAMAINGDALSGQAIINGQHVNPGAWPLGIICLVDMASDFCKAPGYRAVTYNAFAGYKFKANSAETLSICKVMCLLENPTTARVAVSKDTFMKQLDSRVNQDEAAKEDGKEVLVHVREWLKHYNWVTGCLGPHEPSVEGGMPFLPDIAVAHAYSQGRDTSFQLYLDVTQLDFQLQHFQKGTDAIDIPIRRDLQKGAALHAFTMTSWRNTIRHAAAQYKDERDDAGSSKSAAKKRYAAKPQFSTTTKFELGDIVTAPFGIFGYAGLNFDLDAKCGEGMDHVAMQQQKGQFSRYFSAKITHVRMCDKYQHVRVQWQTEEGDPGNERLSVWGHAKKLSLKPTGAPKRKAPKERNDGNDESPPSPRHDSPAAAGGQK